MTNKGFTLWFTGLSGSGKSTLAQYLTPILKERGCNVEVLDGDEVRENLSKGLGFSKEDSRQERGNKYRNTFGVFPNGSSEPNCLRSEAYIPRTPWIQC